MTVVEASSDRLDALDAKMDRLADQLAILTEDAAVRRRQRDGIADLTDDLSRVSEGAMIMAIRELDALSETVDFADTVRLLRHLLEVAPVLERLLVGLETVAELFDDAVPLGSEAMTVVTDRLANADDKGYFRFASAAVGVADRIVTDFDEQDIELLGDNIVAMLDALRQITQPEMLAFLTKALDAVQAEQRAVQQEASEPPSLWTLARQVVDPDVRRGMSRALQTLRAVSVETGPADRVDAQRPVLRETPRNEGEEP